MKIILLANVKNIGSKWDVRHVSDGYARNFLFPQKLARLASQDALEELEEQMREQELEATKELEQIEGTVAAVDGMEVFISTKADEQGKLYAAVTEKTIAKALGEMGFAVPEKAITLEQPIKETGEYKVMAEFEHGLEAELKVLVEAEE
ncbi:MAG: 50S ribosomal protein L9 [Candidatus Spechtbacterales bacterium]